MKNDKDLKLIAPNFKMGKVNLDALIPREDFEVKEENKINLGASINTIDVNGLKANSLFYAILRKPDFQRETNEWEPKKIVGLIESFINGDLIPSLILWHSSGDYIFAIDGAHRLSAILAWINDDYGDGAISKAFFENIPEEQSKIAEQTRNLVNNRVGPYGQYELAATSPKSILPSIVKNSRLLAIRAFPLQWVAGNAEKAEQSFLTINQEATPINPTEKKLIESRHKPNCIAARAIRRSGTGHQYWSHFEEDKQNRIKQIAKEINDLIFVPPYKTPVKSLEFPIAGNQNSGSSLSVILNFVNISNGINPQKESEIKDDKTGDDTLIYLEKCKKMAQRIRSTESFSLGLHPAIYLYSKEGNYKPVSLYALIDFTSELEKNKELIKKFIDFREKFEKVIFDYDYFIPQIVRKHRSGMKAYPFIKDFYISIIKGLSDKKDEAAIIQELVKDEKFNYLTTNPKLEQQDDEETSRDFSVSAKSAIVIKEAIENALRCKICKGLIDSKSITIDHIQRKSEGGLGIIDNGQIAHPYCNTTYKN